jgi:hypothetical protein
MVTIYRSREGLICDYRVYLDPSELWPHDPSPH